jgi:hypothetical protein
MLVELPIDFSIRVNEPLHFRATPTSTTLHDFGFVPKTFRRTLKLPDRGSETQVESRIRPSQATEIEISFEEWQLPHDFRKVHAEMDTAARFLHQLSVLLNFCVEAQEGARPVVGSLAKIDPANGVKLEDEVIRLLLAGRSILTLEGASVLRDERLQYESLIFEALGLSVESPFFAKLRAFLSSPVAGPLIGSLSLAISILNACSVTPFDPNRASKGFGTTISCSIESVRPPQRTKDDLNIDHSRYLVDLTTGGTKSVQQALKLLGCYDGPIDGKDGPLLRAGKERFLALNKVASLAQGEFEDVLAWAMAERFPMRRAT